MKRALLVAATTALVACSSNPSAKWSAEDEAAVGQFFGKCERSAADEEVVYDCGLYVFSMSNKNVDHDAAVDADIATNLETPFLGELEGKKKRPKKPLKGHDVEVTVATFKGKKGTIIQPSVEMYLSQEVDGKHQFFTCFHTLAMVANKKQLEERLARCVKGLAVLAVASR